MSNLKENKEELNQEGLNEIKQHCKKLTDLLLTLWAAVDKEVCKNLIPEILKKLTLSDKEKVSKELLSTIEAGLVSRVIIDSDLEKLKEDANKLLYNTNL